MWKEAGSGVPGGRVTFSPSLSLSNNSHPPCVSWNRKKKKEKRRTALRESLEDPCFQALAEAGCGKNLRVLNLRCA